MHIPFNRVDKLPELLVTGHEDVFFGYEFTVQGGKLPKPVVDYYVSMLSNRESLRGSFGWYRAFDATLAQNEQRKSRKLPMPVLTLAGEASYGPLVGDSMKQLAENVQSVIIPGTGHWLAEDAPAETLAALTAFLTPARSGGRS
jgi:pimeloyl-ACP methyl ester carboxylesterase